MKKGIVPKLILYALKKKGDNHAYGILRAIKELTMNMYTPSTGVLYPALRQLERLKMIESYIKNGRKMYRITKRGENALSTYEDLEEFIKDISTERLPVEEMDAAIKKVFRVWSKLDKDKRAEIVKVINEAISKLNSILGGA